MPIRHHEHQVYGEGLTRTASGETFISVQRLAGEVGKQARGGGRGRTAKRVAVGQEDPRCLGQLRGGGFSGNSVEAINLVSARLRVSLPDSMTRRLCRPDTEDRSIECPTVLWPERLPQAEANAANSVPPEPSSLPRRTARLQATGHEPQLTAKRKR